MTISRTTGGLKEIDEVRLELRAAAFTDRVDADSRLRPDGSGANA